MVALIIVVLRIYTLEIFEGASEYEKKITHKVDDYGYYGTESQRFG